MSQSCLKYVIENRKVQDLSLESFDLNQRLGQGSWGNVYLARHKVTGYICALKAIEKCGIIKDEQEKLLRRELEIHQNLAHPNIIRFLGWFHNETHVYLILEYAPGGDLRTKLFKQKNKRFQEDIAAQYVAQVADAMNYMHSKNIMHRDIKLENILVGLYGEAKLADFGCSIHTPSGRRRTCCGTRDYMAPEIAIMFRQSRRDREPYSHGVDSWSMGVLAYHLMVGKTPFISSTTTQTLHRILSFTGSLNVPGYVTVSKEGRAFMNEVSTRPLSAAICFS